MLPHQCIANKAGETHVGSGLPCSIQNKNSNRHVLSFVAKFGSKCKILLNKSLLEIGPVMFRGIEKIIDYLCQHEVLARSNNLHKVIFIHIKII